MDTKKVLNKKEKKAKHKKKAKDKEA